MKIGVIGTEAAATAGGAFGKDPDRHNTIPAKVIEVGRERLLPHGISAFLCSDDSRAKATVSDLAGDLGFVGVDSGELERAQLIEGVADFIRFQMLSMGRGPLATISFREITVDEGGTA